MKTFLWFNGYYYNTDYIISIRPFKGGNGKYVIALELKDATNANELYDDLDTAQKRLKFILGKVDPKLGLSDTAFE